METEHLEEILAEIADWSSSLQFTAVSISVSSRLATADVNRSVLFRAAAFGPCCSLLKQVQQGAY